MNIDVFSRYVMRDVPEKSYPVVSLNDEPRRVSAICVTPGDRDQSVVVKSIALLT